MPEALTSKNNSETEKQLPPLKLALLADNDTLAQYGPVLRRLTVGIYDDIPCLTLVCRGRSELLEYVPSPPINIISDISCVYETTPTKQSTDLKTTMFTPRLNIKELLDNSARLKRLAEELTARQITLIHALSEKMEKMAAELSKLMNVPYVVSLLSSNTTNYHFKDPKCRHIIPCYSQTARQIRNNNPDNAGKVHLVEIGTHINDSTSCYDFADRWPQIFCCCPLEKNMGIPELLKAAKVLDESGKEFQLMIAGQGKMEFEFRRMAVEMGLGEKVHFIQPVDMIVNENEAFRKVFRMTDIYVQCRPSRVWHPELLEAMSAGNAVVAVGETEHSILVDKTTALLCELHNSKDLAEKLRILIEDKKYARELAISCQQYIKKHFLASDMVEKLVKAYRITHTEYYENLEEPLPASKK